MKTRFEKPLAKAGALTVALPLVCGFSYWIIGLVLSRMPEPIGSRAEIFQDGAWMTMLLTFGAGSLGLGLGIAAAVARSSSLWVPRQLATLYSWIFRGTPLLTQILFVYYAVPVLLPFLKLDEFRGALAALALNVGAYNAEVVRAGMLAIPRGQSEAAQCLGLSRWQTLRKIILPQAIPMMVLPLLNNLVALLKDSAMASTIGLLELTLAGNRVSSETFRPVPVLTTIAATYLFLTTVITLVAAWLFPAKGVEHDR